MNTLGTFSLACVSIISTCTQFFPENIGNINLK